VLLWRVSFLCTESMDEDQDETSDRIRPTSFVCSTRLGVSIVCFFMFFHMFAQRIAMSVAIVSMVNQTAVSMVQDAGMCDSIIHEIQISENRTQVVVIVERSNGIWQNCFSDQATVFIQQQ